jgi:hypothetical protein
MTSITPQLDGQQVGDGILAKSARHFIDVCRQALNAKFVTSRLHQWIDVPSVGSRTSHFLMKRTPSSSRPFTTPR